MNKKVIVLGCGLVGATIARDLADDGSLDVTVADLRNESLAKLAPFQHIRKLEADLSDVGTFAEIVGPFDVVVGALSSALGFETLRRVIEARKPYCDISFMAQDAGELNELAVERGVTAVVDCGVAPGLSNLLAGYAAFRLDETTDIDICVGGLPKVRRWPFDYKAPFAPIDVLAEYTRPARVVVGGKVVTKEAMSEPNLIDFPHVGTLEAFITDGLRSLTKTIRADNMCERTLRYPGHCALMRAFRETGLFSEKAIDVRGTSVRPIDVTSALLFPKWRHEKNEPEYTVMRVTVEGTKGEKCLRYTFDLYDEFDASTGMSSMSRTTGFPAAIIARALADERVRRTGVLAPEQLADDTNLVNHVLGDLARRGVSINETVTERGIEPA